MATDEADDYVQLSKQLRLEGRLDEAVVAARKAVSLDSTDANAWWQLALSLDVKDGGDAALRAFVEVSALAPDFATGHYELASLHHRAGRLDAAVEAYERALSADAGHLSSLRMLALVSKQTGDDARRLEMLRRLYELDELEREDLFDLGYLLGDADDTSEAVKVYQQYTLLYEEPVAFFNLALAYRRLGRFADAVDALQIAARQGYETEQSKKIAESLHSLMSSQRSRVLSKPQPYLPAERWFQHYVNPFSLLNVDPHEIADSPKALQRVKQNLLREIELEDGKVEWMAGLVLDKSSVLSRLAELDIPAAWHAHQVVFENPALNDFLMRGGLEHFLVGEDGAGQPCLAYQVADAVLDRIGPAFAAQYDEVLARAVERGDLAEVQCLFDGRLWVTPAQEDACFQGTRRLLARLAEPLIQLNELADSRTIGLDEVRRVLGTGHLGDLLAHLPIAFYETHHSVGVALRGLSVSFFNREHDAEQAKAILALGKVCAAKSPSLAHQMEKDEKTLDDIIEKEKGHEAHLTLRNEPISITKAGVKHGQQVFSVADIVGIRWGITQTAISPATYRLVVAFESRRNSHISVMWNASGNVEEQRAFWGQLVDAAMEFIVPSVSAHFQQRLDRGEKVSMGPVEVQKDGVVLPHKGWFTTKLELVPWSRLLATMASGVVTLRDMTNHKTTAELDIETTYNAVILHMLAKQKGSRSL